MADTTPTTPTTPTASPGTSWLDLVLVGVAVLLHLFAGWLVAVSGLLAPLWAILVLGAVWLAASVPLVRAVRARARWAPLVPIAVLAVWGAAMVLGDLVLGWTA